MNKTIGQIYIDLHVIQNLNDFYYGLTQEKAFTLQKMINMTYSELFNSYITSKRIVNQFEWRKEKNLKFCINMSQKFTLNTTRSAKGISQNGLIEKKKYQREKGNFLTWKKNKFSTYSDVLLLRNRPDNIFKVELKFIVVISIYNVFSR